MAKPPKADISLIRASTVKLKQTEWLSQDRIPIGELTNLGGDPGIGKTQLGLFFVAGSSRGTLRGDFYGQPQRNDG